MAALVAAALAQIGDRLAWLAAILADRFGRPGPVLAAAALAVAVASGIAAAAGTLAAPLLTPNARALLLAVALILQGGGAWWTVTSPERLDGWRLGAFATAALGLFVLAFGDGVQVIVIALAARAGTPWGAAIGATLGSLAVLILAGLLGERAWTALPLAPIRRGIGAVFVVTGIVLALGALRLT